MKILLDTHILIWFIREDKLLAKKAIEEITKPENEIYYSLISVFEVEIKHMSHPNGISLTGEQLLNFCKEYEFTQVPLKPAHILEMKNLKRRANTPIHKDPFDRLLICQAIVEKMQFVTHDNRIAEYDCTNIYKIN